MRKLGILVVLAFFHTMLMPLSANAGAFKSGYTFMQKCNSAKAQDWGICLGYVQGVADSLENIKQWGVVLAQGSACFPEQVKGEQLRDVIVMYMVDNPKTLPFSAAGTSIKALVAAYPCGNK